MIATIKPYKLNKMNVPSADITSSTFATALDSSEGGKIAWDFQSEKAILIAVNGNGSPKELTIKAGDRIQGTTDLKFEIAGNSQVIISLESGRFVNDSGDIVLKDTDGSISVACCVAP